MYIELFYSIHIYIYIHRPEVLISSYGTPFVQRASYLALHSSLFGPDGAVNYDYINSSLMFPMAYTLTIFKPIWPIFQKLSKTLI